MTDFLVYRHGAIEDEVFVNPVAIVTHADDKEHAQEIAEDLVPYGPSQFFSVVPFATCDRDDWYSILSMINDEYGNPLIFDAREA